MAKERAPKGGKPGAPASVELSRDMYGFMVRPQHVERYREYCPIYKEEEAERSERWDQFLRTINENVPPPNGSLDLVSSVSSNGNNGDVEGQDVDNTEDASTLPTNRIMIEAEPGATKLWGQLRKSLWAIEQAGDIRHRGIDSQSSHSKENQARNGGSVPAELEPPTTTGGYQESDGPVDAVKEAIYSNGHSKEDPSVTDTSPDMCNGVTGRVSEEGSGDDTEEEFEDASESADVLQDGDHIVRSASSPAVADASPTEKDNDGPWDAELRSLVRGGVPMALRGELWQVFVGTKKRRAYGHYHALLTLLADGGGDSDGVGGLLERNGGAASNYVSSKSGVLEKWTNQIEKDLPRTFPGHPALDEDGRNALRRLLTAYARHNPSVGYCQAMNFLAALLLLLMPEENAFWTLTGIIDEYFEGYYSEKMVEAQVDQLVFEDLVREQFPKLVNHLDTLAVQVAWVSGPWFLSIFVNVLPWESVLRVWDVLLFEGNRCMLFRTALALMEIYGPALSATRDAGDAVSLLQSMASATFDSSQLVMIACMGFQSVTESRLQKLRVKHRPEVLAALQERSIELNMWRNSNAAITPKLPILYSKEGSDGDSLLMKKTILVTDDQSEDALLKSPQTRAAIDAQRLGLTFKLPVFFQETSIKTPPVNGSNPSGSDEDDEETSGSDLQEQIKWLKDELSRALEERKAATVRAGELESALLELSVQDNRRLLAAKVEKLEREVGELTSTLAQKEEHEASLVQVLVRMEQEQRIADDARRFAEQDVAALRHAAELLEAKCEASIEAVKEMEKRAVMAESMLEATLSYQALGNNSPHGSFRRSSMDPLLVRPPEATFGSPLENEDTGISRSFSDGINGPSKVEHSDEKTRKQGIFGRQFSLNWRDKTKGRTATSMDSPRSLESPRTLSLSNSKRGFDADTSLPSSGASTLDSD